jgi:uncharacterized protein (TIGR02328 family)
MRLWHVDIIPYLPTSQLIAQWRELNSIFKKQDKHILINYIYDYDITYLYSYTQKVLDEMSKRNLKIKKWTNFNKYFQMLPDAVAVNLRFTEHNSDYLTICYYNLMEKYLRGQHDFTDEIMWNLNEFYARKRHKVAQN